ncbi:MAG: DMT family transporter [Alphaproteobacteria bacterium]|jgi:drug/metabolite transporter (DMT)-like permease|nr:DMT family transporter [Alphaproteobacteria bacterium]
MSQAAQRRRAILLVLGAALLFSGAAACVKALEGGIPLAMVVLFRSLFALPIMVPILLANGGLRALRTSQPGGHALRVLFGLVGMAGAFHGYATLPLATVTALGFTMPLFLTLLSIPLLGERVGIRRFSAVLVGFLGVLVMLRPGLDAPGTWFDYGFVLLAALGWALAMITIRRMGENGEPGAAIVLWFAIGASVVGLAFALPVWVWPSGWQWVLLIGAGLVSGIAQLFMTEAYRRGDTTVIAPFEYSGIIWTGMLGFFIWAEAPDGFDALGIAILVGCGLYIWHREVTLGIKR